MSIFFTLAFAATVAAQPAPPAVVDHSKHATQQQHAQHQRHMAECKDMMAKMHQGMKHEGRNESGNQAAPEHADHKGH